MSCSQIFYYFVCIFLDPSCNYCSTLCLILGAASSSIESKNSSPPSDNICTICMDEDHGVVFDLKDLEVIAPESEPCRLNCWHPFHRTCITNYIAALIMKTNPDDPKCPNCRNKIVFICGPTIEVIWLVEPPYWFAKKTAWYTNGLAQVAYKTREHLCVFCYKHFNCFLLISKQDTISVCQCQVYGCTRCEDSSLFTIDKPLIFWSLTKTLD